MKRSMERRYELVKETKVRLGRQGSPNLFYILDSTLYQTSRIRIIFAEKLKKISQASFFSVGALNVTFY